MTNQSNLADTIFNATTSIPKVVEVLSEAWKYNDVFKRDRLRNELKNLLSDKYKLYQDVGLLQYHFVFPDNKVFLRMHKSDKYGDDLSLIRSDFKKVNTTHEIVRGFSAGKTSHAFRNIYPIYDKSNIYIGAVEISFPSELLQKKLNKISELHSHFLVHKKVFTSKSWSRDDKVMNYTQSEESQEYLLAVSDVHERKDKILDIKLRFELLREEVDEKMGENNMFSLLSNIDNNIKVISFFPIFDATSYEVVAWIVSYDNDKFIATSIRDALKIRFIALFIITLLIYFLYRITSQKDELKKLVQSYDENVIFSKTDTKGIITHVSQAFCEISGYRKDEIIGKPHNIVRHPDMSKKIFKNMWETIQSGKTWKGEVKNVKKDGDFYWVNAEITPIFSNKNKIIAYSAIRHDITAAKEIESIQREVIFTMGSIGESRSRETGNHVKRVSLYSEIFACKVGLNQKEVELLKQASPMHDIGKVSIPDAILKKPSKLDAHEWEIMQTHALNGYNMLKHSDRPLLKTAATVALEHHEKYDGTGYPNGLKGEDIHIYGRITAIADVFDALGSKRYYKEAWPDDDIFEFFRRERGKHFDPKLVDLFFEHLELFLEVRNKFKD